MVKVAIIIVVLSLFFGSSSGFMHQNGRVNLHQSRIYMGDTTPLVANGKRFEAEPGSSLMTVSRITNTILYVRYVLSIGLCEVGSQSSN